MAKHNILGQKGEEKAKLYLESHGYQIIELNWTYRHLEIDIIALKSNTLCFIEVKTRENKLYGEPYQAFTLKKQKNILVAASHYIKSHKIDFEIRFDLITIITSQPTEFIHYEDVIRPFIF